MVLGCFRRVMRRMGLMPVCAMRVVSRRLMLSSTVMLSRVAMVLCGMFVVFRCFGVMFLCLF